MAEKAKPSTLEILRDAKSSALKGGIAGGAAQVINVCSLMWLRTTMNHQYRYGGGTRSTISKLWKEGGIPRFYRGLTPALIQSPVARFGDTAANVGILALLDGYESTAKMPIGLKTAAGSCGAAVFRIFLMPIDAWKTTKQVEGKEGLRRLYQKGRQHGVRVYFHGALAAMSATWVGHYPWFFAHNFLSENLPQFDFTFGRHVRYAFIGFVSSVISDTCSNSIRVVKTTRQTATTPMTYPEAFRGIIAKDGILGLLGRGLGTRILTNGISGCIFSVGWKSIQQMLNDRSKTK